MRKNIILFMVFILFFTGFILSQGVREPIASGTFYDANPAALTQRLEYLFQKAAEEPVVSGRVMALIAPHAGYIYSGRVAASAYRQIQGKNYETVIIIAPSHQYAFKGCSIYPQGAYKTPLGLAQIDKDIASKISKASGFKYIPQAHRKEHSVEVQIPFIQHILPQAKIVPVVMGVPSQRTITSLARALSKVLEEEKYLIVASTDMSHYYPQKKANDVDSHTISLIESFQTQTLINKLERRENIMCGGGPVVSTLLYAKEKGEAEVKILQYADSSRFGSDKSRVVGYCAAAVYLPPASGPFTLSLPEKEKLLTIARLAIEEFVLKNKVLNYHTQDPNLWEKKGAFVTIKKRGRLRGCIGFIEPERPLYQTIIQAAVYAACKDQRFPPLSPQELKDLEVEISVLSPLKKIHNPGFIQVGKHGLLISRGKKSGLLLPQVPVENNWSRETFLQQACLKAGLPPNAWKQGADLYVFEATVFH
ncbi:MAG: AmmeMemoRadiSam system protein B [Candidatus Aminicenantes bacterium]